MSDSESSYDDSDREEESDASTLTSSDTDAEVKYLTFPNRGMRWPVGSPKPKNPVRGTTWNMHKGLRLSSEDQQDLTRYVPGRMPKLVRKAEGRIAAEYKEGGAGSTKAICQVCKKKFPFSTDPEVESKELMDHVVECWGPTEEAPFGLYDERFRQPTVMGNVAVEGDEDCLVFSVHSPGPFGGAYMMLLAFPLWMKPGLDMIDTTLRREWFHEDKKCSHLSMFIKRSTGSVEEERKMYSGFRENMAMTAKKEFADNKFLKESKNGYPEEGRVVWAREHKGIFWPAVLMAEEGTGNLARRDPDEDEDESWDRYWSLQWHVVFLGREGKRMWARGTFDNFKSVFEGKEEVKDWFRTDIPYPEGEEKILWEKAVEMATKMSTLGCDEVLSEMSKLGLTSGGEEIVDMSLVDVLVDRFGEEQKTQMMESWKKDFSQFKWSFYKALYRHEIPHPLPVEKVDGFTYWPIMSKDKGDEEGEEEEVRKEWEHLLTPDRTDMELEEIFTEPGESAIYHFHPVDGFRSRCKVVFLGQKLLRMRGKTRPIPCGAQLERDPEYERDVERINRTTPDGYQKPKPEDLIIYHCLPPSDKPSILARNEPPFIPCTNCKENTAEFCDVGKTMDFRSLENPDTRLKEHVAVFCSTTCGRAWSDSTKTELPVGDTMDMENSPRAGMCEFSNNIFIPLHLMPLHKMEKEMFGPNKAGYGLYPVVNYIEDEKAEGRHHPLWPKEKRREYRDNKRGWQDRILGRIEKFGLEVPPKKDLVKHYYD